MKRAFTVSFPTTQGEEQSNQPEDDIEDLLEPALCAEELWETRDDREEIIEMIDLAATQRLSCFAHTLQLVIADALKIAKGLNLVISKVKSISSLLHQSSSMKVSKISS